MHKDCIKYNETIWLPVVSNFVYEHMSRIYNPKQISKTPWRSSRMALAVCYSINSIHVTEHTFSIVLFVRICGTLCMK